MTGPLVPLYPPDVDFAGVVVSDVVAIQARTEVIQDAIMQKELVSWSERFFLSLQSDFDDVEGCHEQGGEQTSDTSGNEPLSSAPLAFTLQGSRVCAIDFSR